MDRLELLLVVAGLGVGGAIPSITVTGGCGPCGLLDGIDGEMQRDGAVAAMDCLEMLHIIARVGVGLVVPGEISAHPSRKLIRL